MRFENQTLTGLTLSLDEDEFIGCQLIDCQVMFGGTRLPVYSGNDAIGCRFQFAASAQITIDLLRGMLKAPSLRELVLGELGLLAAEDETLH